MDISAMYLIVVFLIIHLSSASFQDLNKVKVKPGENVTLQCQSPKDAIITLLEWIRPDLNSEGYVFFYRDEHLYGSYQHPSYMDRVELRQPGMKDGDVSVILKNVNNNDTGIYECFVSVSKASRIKRASPDFRKTIELEVEDSGLTAGLSAAGQDLRRHFAASLPLIGVIVVGFGIIL